MNRPPPTFQTRRDFLALSLAALGAIGLRDLYAKEADVPPIGLCASLDKAQLAHEAGIDFLEIGIVRSLGEDVSDTEFEEWLAVLKAAPLPASRAVLFFPGSMKLVGPDRDLGQIRDYVEMVAARASKAGVALITLGSGGSRRAPEGMDIREATDQFIETCREIVPITHKNNIVVAIEPLNREETNLLNGLGEVCEVVDAVDHPSLGATADLFHMLRENDGPDVLKAAGSRVRHCHLAEKAKRTPPGVEGEDFTPYLAVLAEMNYQGFLSLECRWSEMESQLSAARTEVATQWRRAVAG